MTVAKISITDLQFGPADSDVVQAEKLRRLVDELRKLQQVANALIADVSRVAGAEVSLAPGEWYATIVAGSPPTFTVRYNDGGTIRTGSITLS